MAKKTKLELKTALNDLKTLIMDVKGIRQGMKMQLVESREAFKSNLNSYTKQGRLIEAAQKKMIKVREQIKKAA